MDISVIKKRDGRSIEKDNNQGYLGYGLGSRRLGLSDSLGIPDR